VIARVHRHLADRAHQPAPPRPAPGYDHDDLAVLLGGDMLGGDMLGGDMLGGDMLGGDMLGGDMLGEA
jgi:hypothetical protein